MKLVPGQLNFAALAPGQTAPFDVGALQRAGLPIAPYIEHGSWTTGQPDIMSYGRDPYRGMMGVPHVRKNLMHTRRLRLDRNQGNYSFPGRRYASQPLLGVGSVSEYLCSDTQVAKVWKERTDTVLRDSTLIATSGAVVAGVLGAVLGRPLLGAILGGVVGYMLHQTQMSVYATE